VSVSVSVSVSVYVFLSVSVFVCVCVCVCDIEMLTTSSLTLFFLLRFFNKPKKTARMFLSEDDLNLIFNKYKKNGAFNYLAFCHDVDPGMGWLWSVGPIKL